MTSWSAQHPQGTKNQLFWDRAVRHETIEGEPARLRHVLELRVCATEQGSAVQHFWNALESWRDAGSLPPTLQLLRSGNDIRLRIEGITVDASLPRATQRADDALRDAVQATGKMLGMGDRTHDSDIIGNLAYRPEIAGIVTVSYRDRAAAVGR